MKKHREVCLKVRLEKIKIKLEVKRWSLGSLYCVTLVKSVDLSKPQSKLKKKKDKTILSILN